jgi:hypothetical protein
MFWRVCITFVAMQTRQYLPFLLLLVYIKGFNVAMERRQLVPFALLSSYKIFNTAVSNDNYLIV